MDANELLQTIQALGPEAKVTVEVSVTRRLADYENITTKAWLSKVLPAGTTSEQLLEVYSELQGQAILIAEADAEASVQRHRNARIAEAEAQTAEAEARKEAAMAKAAAARAEAEAKRAAAPVNTPQRPPTPPTLPAQKPMQTTPAPTATGGARKTIITSKPTEEVPF